MIFVRPDSSLVSEPGFVYHATNERNLYDIISDGELKTFEPWEGTDQEEWPDGSTQKRSYWSREAGVVWMFAPEEGRAVILRTPETKQFRQESTGDTYTTKPVSVDALEVLTDGGWVPAKGFMENPKKAKGSTENHKGFTENPPDHIALRTWGYGSWRSDDSRYQVGSHRGTYEVVDTETNWSAQSNTVEGVRRKLEEHTGKRVRIGDEWLNPLKNKLLR